jgi:hypothetical protein
MHDVRQWHCPIITPALHCLKGPRLALLLWSHCQPQYEITSRNKISHEVKLLACDLKWKIFAPFLTPVNSREMASLLRILVRIMSPQVFVTRIAELGDQSIARVGMVGEASGGCR